MTKEDVHEIIDAIQQNRQEQRDKDKWVDWLFKALIGVLVYFGVEMRQDVSDIKDKQADMSDAVIINQEAIKQFTMSVNSMRSFMSEPRFTKQDFSAGVNPIITQMNRNSLQIEENHNDISDIEDRILKIEFDYSKNQIEKP